MFPVAQIDADFDLPRNALDGFSHPPAAGDLVYQGRQLLDERVELLRQRLGEGQPGEVGELLAIQIRESSVLDHLFDHRLHGGRQRNPHLQSLGDKALRLVRHPPDGCPRVRPFTRQQIPRRRQPAGFVGELGLGMAEPQQRLVEHLRLIPGLIDDRFMATP